MPVQAALQGRGRAACVEAAWALRQKVLYPGNVGRRKVHPPWAATEPGQLLQLQLQSWFPHQAQSQAQTQSQAQFEVQAQAETQAQDQDQGWRCPPSSECWASTEWRSSTLSTLLLPPPAPHPPALPPSPTSFSPLLPPSSLSPFSLGPLSPLPPSSAPLPWPPLSPLHSCFPLQRNPCALHALLPCCPPSLLPSSSPACPPCPSSPTFFSFHSHSPVSWRAPPSLLPQQSGALPFIPLPSTLPHAAVPFSSSKRSSSNSSTGGGGSSSGKWVDGHGVEHFRRRGLQAWLPHPPPPLSPGRGPHQQQDQSSFRGGVSWSFLRHHWEKLAVASAAFVGGGAVLYYSNLQTVPYTNRRHFVLIPVDMEKELGETQFKQLRKEFQGSEVPPTHPLSQRVRRISVNIIKAATQDLNEDDKQHLQQPLESTTAAAHHSSSRSPGSEAPGAIQVPISWGGHDRDTGALKNEEEGADPWAERAQAQAQSRSGRDDLLRDNAWLEAKRRSSQNIPKPFRAHLKGLEWEVLVINRPIMNAFCLPGGKIVVFTGLLSKFQEDGQIATVLGHEVGHIVARHGAERLSQGMVLGLLQVFIAILLQGDFQGLLNLASQLFFSLPFSRMHELEADKIGLLLMASAGYDPSIAPSVYVQLDESETSKEDRRQVTDREAGKGAGEVTPEEFFATHPSGRRRAVLLARSEAMGEAKEIYAEYLRQHSLLYRIQRPFGFF